MADMDDQVAHLLREIKGLGAQIQERKKRIIEIQGKCAHASQKITGFRDGGESVVAQIVCEICGEETAKSFYSKCPLCSGKLAITRLPEELSGYSVKERFTCETADCTFGTHDFTIWDQ